MKVTVYDLYKIDRDAYNYLNDHQDEFTTDGIYDNDKYNQYKLDNMLKTNEKISYEVEFKLNKKDGDWVLENPDRVVLEKLHGLYNYENK